MDGETIAASVPKRARNWPVVANGFCAFQQGRSVRDCPHGRMSPDFWEWVRGYLLACLFARVLQTGDRGVPQKFPVKHVPGRADWHPAEAAFLTLAWRRELLRTCDIAGALGRPVRGVRGKAVRLGLGGRAAA